VELERGVVGGLFRGRAIIVGVVRDRAPRSLSPVLGRSGNRSRDCHFKRVLRTSDWANSIGTKDKGKHCHDRYHSAIYRQQP